MEKTDITSTTDVTKLIKSFYDKLLLSPIKHHFDKLNLEEHLPRVDSFWNAVIFPDQVYTTNLLEKHMHLPFKKGDFEIWIELFKLSVDESYSGTTAEMVKNRATNISYIMQMKLLKE